MSEPLTATTDKGRVLLVDDEEALRRAYARVLSRRGLDVDTAATGQQAVELFREREPDVVVTDLSMPEMDGMALLRAIREHDLDCPVILVTGRPGVDSAIEAVRHGALRYLVKPVEHEELVGEVTQAVSLARMARLRRQMVAASDGGYAVGDLAGLQVRFERALERIHLVYQPIVRWSSREVYGYEALVRSREESLPHPGALFDAAERLDRIVDLGRAIRRLTPEPFHDVDHHLFLNLHTAEIDDPTLLEDGPLTDMADRVVVEITERASLDAVPDARAHLAAMRERGFRVAVDDLGAGYAGLNSFAMLEPEVVKIDMALVRDVHERPVNQKLIAAVAEVCNDLDMELVAEGVETAVERDTLVGLGCDLFQGYFFAKPAPPFTDVRWG